MTPPRAFYLLVNGKPHGPFPAETLRRQFASGILRPGTQVSTDGFTWRPVEMLMAEMGGPASPSRTVATPPPAPVPVRTPAPKPPAISRPFSPVLPPPPPANGNGTAAGAMLALVSLCLLLSAVLVGLLLFRARPVASDDGVGDFGDATVAEVPGTKPAEPAPPADVPVLQPVKPPAQPKVLNAQMLVEKCAPSVAMVAFANGHGSGFLVDRDLLATNAHVVGNRDNVNVRIFFPSATDADKGPHNGRVVYMNKGRDLALIRVKSELPFLKMGDSSVLKKGEDVVVIGSPGLGPGGGVLPNAVSKGVYSTMADLAGEGEYLQMSLAVNPGNSGGPAFNDRGEVVGVVTAKGKFVEGVALCVPVNDLKFAIENAR